MLEKDDGLLDWLYFINDPNSERAKESMKRNKYIKEAADRLRKLSEDEEMQKIVEEREKELKEEKERYDREFKSDKEKGMK